MNSKNLPGSDRSSSAVAPADVELLDLEQLRNRIADAGSPIPLLRAAIQHARGVLDERFKQNLNITDIVCGRAWVVDEVLRLAWQAQNWPDDDISLVAVGGYGRGELLPHSDIDLLLLTHRNRNLKYKNTIGSFLTMCWDIGLQIGQSVRSIKQCKTEAIRDITVCTALMESRTLIGPEELHSKMVALTRSRRVWPIKKFLRAKLDEQIARHDKYHDVDYALEPNVKTSPGGLRDIQTIAWVAKRHYDASSFQDLVELGFLQPSEETILNRGQQFLWKLRYGLHYLGGHSEDRLLFDKQRELALLIGYEDDDKSLGVEKLMQEYYHAVDSLRELNDLLLQHLDEAILRARERETIKPLNNRFQIRNGYIEVVNERVFEQYPSALLEIFVLSGQDDHIEGIRASTVRRGLDPRDFALCSFGGAGGLHADAVARELLMPSAIIPREASVLSALGFLGSDVRNDYQLTLAKSVPDLEAKELAGAFAELEDEGRRLLHQEGFAGDQIRVSRIADCRYLRQVFTVEVPIDASDLEKGDLDWLVEKFEAAYQALYHHVHKDEDGFIDTCRVTVFGELPALQLPRHDQTDPDPAPARRGERSIYFGDRVTAPVYWFDDLLHGMAFAGPALIDSPSTTVLVPPGSSTRVDVRGSVLIEPEKP